jgi:hypothetical protein
VHFPSARSQTSARTIGVITFLMRFASDESIDFAGADTPSGALADEVSIDLALAEKPTNRVWVHLNATGNLFDRQPRVILHNVPFHRLQS